MIWEGTDRNIKERKMKQFNNIKKILTIWTIIVPILLFTSISCVQVAGDVNASGSANISTGGTTTSTVVNDTEPNNTITNALPLTTGTTAEGTITSVGDVDTYAINTTAGSIYSAVVTPPAGEVYYVRILDTAGNIIADNNSSNITWNAYTGGTYYVQIYSTSSFSDAASYALNVDPSAPFGTVANPAFSPAAGTYSANQSVQITTATNNAEIRYTLDGTTPDCINSTLLSGSFISVTNPQAIKAISCKTGYSPSAVVTADYLFQTPDPVISLSGGIYTTAQTTSLSNTLATAIIHFTTNGTTPDCNSPTYTAPINLGLATTTTVKSIACNSTWTPSAVISATYTITGQTAAPTASITTGIYTSSQTVTLSSVTAASVIYYTTNGSNPSCQTPVNGTLYSTPVAIATTTTLKAVACALDYLDSAISTFDYTITGILDPPTFSLSSASSYSTSPQTVFISSAQSSIASYYYTLNGTAPSCLVGGGSTLYTLAGIQLTGNTTLNAVACNVNWLDSSVSTANYTFQTPNPQFSIAAGTYTTAQNISITDAQPSATIHYTTDGTAPTCTSTPFTGPILISASTTIKAIACNAGWNSSAVINSLITITGQVAAPTVDVPGATYTTVQNLSLTTTTPGASIYYTLNGTAPTCQGAGNLYTAPIQLAAGTVTLNAIACLTTWTDSTLLTQTYTINTTNVIAPSFSVTGGTYNTAQAVTVGSGTTGASIYYTTDGTTPNCLGTAGTLYLAPVSINVSTTINAIACKATFPDSTISSVIYTLTPVAPVFNVAAGTYNSTQTVTITDGTTGAAIYYTTNGTTPTCASTLYSAPVAINVSTTLKAVACVTGWSTSTVTSAAYTLQVGTPSFSIAAGIYQSAQTVTISLFGAPAGTTYRYTIDGTAATCTSTAGSSVSLGLNSTTTISAIACNTGWTASNTIAATYTITGTVATPLLSLATGTYNATQTVVLTTATAGASIYYTLNGTTPNCTSTLYSGSIPVTVSTTVKAIGCLTNWTNSVVATEIYTLQVPTPTFSIAAGTYTTAQTVNISIPATAGAVIYYTTNGTTPTCASTAGTSVALGLNSTTTIKAIACNTGWTSSVVASAIYTITGTVATPAFSIAAGTYTTNQSLTLSTTTGGASIYYTTNGTTPTCTSTLYTAAISVTASTTIKAIGCLTNWTNSTVASATYTLQVPAPVFTPAASTYLIYKTITITGSGTSIRYTTTGTAPTCATGTLYSAPIKILDSTLFKAVACQAGWSDSAVTTASYTLNFPNIIAYAYASSPTTASYTISTMNLFGGTYAYNYAGGAVTATRTAVGTYKIDFAGAAIGAAGVAHVKAAHSNARCNALSWAGTFININCYDPTGALVDSAYLVEFVQSSSNTLGAKTIAYAYENSASAALNTPWVPAYGYNISGQANSVTHTGTGTYTITFPGSYIAASNLLGSYSLNGNVQISARVGGYNCVFAGTPAADTIAVNCYNASGALANGYFVIHAVSNTATSLASTAKILAYGWADLPSTASYSLLTSYSYNADNAGVTVARSATGTYVLTFTGAGISTGGNAEVSAYGSNANCYFVNWGSPSADTISVNCVNSSGTLVDSKFDVTYVK